MEVAAKVAAVAEERNSRDPRPSCVEKWEKARCRVVEVEKLKHVWNYKSPECSPQ